MWETIELFLKGLLGVGDGEVDIRKNIGRWDWKFQT